jgi:protein phosphatase PTC7
VSLLYVYSSARKENDALKLFYQSPEQQRDFNFPYQIGSQGDPPQMAELNHHDVQNDDIVIAGSDGLFDNLDANQIIAVINPFVPGQVSAIDPILVSEMITDLCYKKSLDP